MWPPDPGLTIPPLTFNYSEGAAIILPMPLGISLPNTPDNTLTFLAMWWNIGTLVALLTPPSSVRLCHHVYISTCVHMCVQSAYNESSALDSYT